MSHNTFIFIFTQLRRDRGAGCLDVDVKHDNGNDLFFRCLGPGRFSRHPSRCDHDGLRPGADFRAQGCVSTKPDLLVHVARAARNAIASGYT